MIVLRDFIADLDSTFRSDPAKKKDEDLIRVKLKEILEPFNLWPMPDPQHPEAKISIIKLCIVLGKLWHYPYHWRVSYPQWYSAMAKQILEPLEKNIWSKVPVFNIEDYPSRLRLSARHRR
jgi:hypothetical protein